jgi:tetratricopeptide (TPR) repeat protein
VTRRLALLLVATACATAPVLMKAQPELASQMSLAQAARLVQRAHGWVWVDGAADHNNTTWVFTPTHFEGHWTSVDGRSGEYSSWSYDEMDPYVSPVQGTVDVGTHKGAACFWAYAFPPREGNWGMCARSLEQAQQAAAALLRWKQATAEERAHWREQDRTEFERVAAGYRSVEPKPELPEEARRFKVVAETAVREKRFEDAAQAYEDGAKVAPWNPDFHYNASLMLAQVRYFAEAAEEMKKYLALAPDSGDARAAQDKVYEWEDKAHR